MSAAHIDLTRPLLALADEVNATGTVVVTYEDTDLASSPPSVPPAVTAGAATGDAIADPVAALRQAASEYEHLGNAGRFTVVEAAPMIHVIGNALLDQVVSLPAVAGSGMDFLRALRRSLGGPIPLAMGMVPLNV